MLFSIMASIGSIAVVPDTLQESTANRAVGILVPKEEAKINPYYFKALFMTDVGMDLFERLRRGGLQQRINLADISALKVPVPDLEGQNQIAAVMQEALDKKRQKEAQATALLASIDDYLLKALAVTLPPQVPDNVQQRIFYAPFNRLMSGRFDPLYHSIDLFRFLEKLDYPVVPLQEVTCYMVTGFAAGRSDQSLEPAVIQIRPTNIDDNRDLVFEKNVYIKREELLERPGDILRKGEVLFNNTNSQTLVGKTAYFDLDGEYFCSNHITRIGVDKARLSPYFLTALLNLYQRQQIFYRLCTNWNNQSGVNIGLLQTIPIPLPSFTTQNKIADHIRAIRQRAATLEQKAQDVLAQAKAQVEQMILGEGV